MFEKKEELIPMDSGSAETVVGASVKLKGNLKSDGDIKINGSVSGDIKTKASVRVGQEANVVAGIQAKNVHIAGVVQGNIDAKDTLQISESGKVYGDIQAGILVVSPGALFTGKCSMVETKKEVDIEPMLEEMEEEPSENKKSKDK